MTHPTPKDPEGSISKSGCCEKCLLSDEAFKAGKMPSCLAYECPCHLPPAAESVNFLQVGANRPVRSKCCKSSLRLGGKVTTHFFICNTCQEAADMENTIKPMHNSPESRHKTCCEICYRGITNGAIFDRCDNAACKCHQPVAEESGESWKNRLMKLKIYQHDNYDGTSGPHCLDIMDVVQFIRSELSLAHKAFNEALVRELEGMKNKEYYSDRGKHELNGRIKALEEIIRNHQK